ARSAYVYVGPPQNSQQSVNASDCAARLETTTWNFDRYRGYSWADGQYRSALYNHYYPPNYPQPDCIGVTAFSPIANPTNQQANTPTGWKTARSLHAGGVNILLGDGSVRFLSND